MTDSSAVHVQSAIVHIVDRAGSAPVLSEIDLDLVAHEHLLDYFTGQVQNALEDDNTAAAKFAADPPHGGRDQCRSILEDEKQLVPASQELARLMYAAMGSHPNIKAGLLAVCTYTNGGHARHLALIKLDPGSGLVHRMGERNGKKLITFDEVHRVMPTAGERLQKAALLPPIESEEYDLLLLDRQTAEPSAAWWSDAFLHATVMINGKIGARMLRDVSYRASDVLMKLGLVTAAEADAVKAEVDAALHHEKVRRSALVARLPISKDAKTYFGNELEAKFKGTPMIPIDVPYASAKLTKTRKYRGDYGFVLEVESERFDAVVKEMEAYTDKDGTPMTRIRLEVPNLQRVK